MTPRWQILICSVYYRTAMLADLLDQLAWQLLPHAGNAEVLIDRDDCEQPVGAKRTRLVQAATADYIAFVDDDDLVSDDYADRIMLALADTPDCVGFHLAYTVNGQPRKPAVHSTMFNGWHEDEHGYYRTPNHLNPVRREIALRALPFRDGFGEDRAYADAIAPHLHTETLLAGDPVYNYRYSTAGSLFAGGTRQLGYRPELPAYGHVREIRHHKEG